jgi:hypothetical protein
MNEWIGAAVEEWNVGLVERRKNLIHGGRQLVN